MQGNEASPQERVHGEALKRSLHSAIEQQSSFQSGINTSLMSRTNLIYHIMLNVADGQSTELSPKHEGSMRVSYVEATFIDHPNLRSIHIAPMRSTMTDAFKLCD